MMAKFILARTSVCQAKPPSQLQPLGTSNLDIHRNMKNKTLWGEEVDFTLL